MATTDWTAVLKRWSDAILAAEGFADALPAECRERGWAGAPPATDEAISALERRLKVRLPDSYKAFLRVSNGWWLEGTAGPVRLYGVEEVRPARDVDPEWVDIWGHGDSEDEGTSDDFTDLPPAHYRRVLMISEDNDGRYLLNPAMPTDPGECQACFHAAWVPGAECHVSFGAMMLEKYEAFLAANPPPVKQARTRSIQRPQGAERPPAKKLNLRHPPSTPGDDPEAFCAELDRCGFFSACEPEVARRIRAEFLELARAARANPQFVYSGKGSSPGKALIVEETGRVARLDEARLAGDRAAYAVARIRPMLAAVTGVELGTPEERATPDSYAVRLDGVEHTFFRLKNGAPAIAGGEHRVNAARYVMFETTKLVNRWLASHGHDARIATVEALDNNDRSHEPRVDLSFVIVTDELSYLFMWSPVLDNYCRPMRPDVFQ